MNALIDEQVVRAPDGREWIVGIRWLPRRPTWMGWGPGRRRRKRGSSDWSWMDIPDPGCVPDELPALAAVVAVVVVLMFLWFAVLPIAVFALDLLFLLLLAVGGIAMRVFFRRPWIVEAATDDDTRRWPIVGFRSSRAMVGEVSWAIQNGRALEEL
jgi:hypothetical protein